jgi:pSer/pThr/pTyr-binding forkhead associated (FHA) protein
MSEENKPLYKLIVEAGPDKGQEFALPFAGARIGRSSQNDIALTDPLLSRHHCRMEMRGTELWAVDLASANQTLVNGKAIEEMRLSVGNKVQIGDTIMRVATLDGSTSEPVAPAATVSAEMPVIDLGLSHGKETAAAPHRNVLRPLLWAVAGAAVLLLGATFILDDQKSKKPAVQPVAEAHDLTMQIVYEKIEADPDSIFRYAMTLSPDGMLAICIDDLREKRHVRQEKKVDQNLLNALAHDIESGGFFALDPAYVGINANPGAMNTWDLTIIIGRRAHRCHVANRIEPDVFRAVREKIETFGKNELGLWAIQFSREKLVELASDACRVGKKFYDDRDVNYGNLATAIQHFKEADFYLQTIDPKPDFYAAIVEGRRQATEELDNRYKDQKFRVDRASNLQDWPTAVKELRVLRDMIPDRNDDRNKEAEQKLNDAEMRLRETKH